MKHRFGFVSNSSSSSFLVLGCNDEDIVEQLKCQFKYRWFKVPKITCVEDETNPENMFKVKNVDLESYSEFEELAPVSHGIRKVPNPSDCEEQFDKDLVVVWQEGEDFIFGILLVNEEVQVDKFLNSLPEKEKELKRALDLLNISYEESDIKLIVGEVNVG